MIRLGVCVSFADPLGSIKKLSCYERTRTKRKQKSKEDFKDSFKHLKARGET